MLLGLRVRAGLAFVGILYAGILPGFSSPGEPIKLIGGSALIDKPRPRARTTAGSGLACTLAVLAHERIPAPPPVGEPADGSGPVVPPSFSSIEIAPDGHVRFQGRGTPGTRVTLNRQGQPLASAVVSEKGDWVVLLGERIGSGVHVFGSVAAKVGNGIPIVGSDVRISIPNGFGAGMRPDGAGATDNDATADGTDVRHRAEQLARGANRRSSEIERQRLNQLAPEQGTPARPAPGQADKTEANAKEGALAIWLHDWLASSNRDFQGKIVRPLQVPGPQSGTAGPEAELERHKADAERRSAEDAEAQAEAATRAKAERIAAERFRQEERRREEERRAAAAADARDAEAARQAEAQHQAEDAARAEEAKREAAAARQAELQGEREVQQQAEAERRADAERKVAAEAEERKRQQAAAEEARRKREAEERAAVQAKERERRLREERERELLAAEAEEKRRRAEDRAALEAERRRSHQQRIAAKAELLRSLDKPATRAGSQARRQEPGSGLRGGDGTPDDTPAPASSDRRVSRPVIDRLSPDGHIMPDGWRRLAQRYSGATESRGATGTADGSQTAATVRREPRVMAMARRASDRSCSSAGSRIKLPGTYVVQSGDSLWSISQRHYQRGKHWPVIYRANNDEIDDPDLIYPCQRFQLPRLSGNR